MTFPDPIASFAAWWRFGVRAQEIALAGALDASTIRTLQDDRLACLVEYARACSPFYRHHYRRLPAGTTSIGLLPPVSKPLLMACFDDWVTDPRIRLHDVERFVADPARIGEPYLGRYALWTSSGSTGRPGIFVQDEDALATYDALLATRFPSTRAGPSPMGALASGARLAMIAATGGHFAGVVSWERLRRAYPWIAPVARSFSVLSPLRELVAQLDDYRPALLASYPTTLLLLAQEREAGRLHVAPRAIWSGGETLAAAERRQIARAFGCPVTDGYGASEFMNIAFDCGHGALHLNSDWVILEPIDADGRATPPGRPSASTRLTNLANRVQPLIRYDLGDSVEFLRAPCPCGSPFPAIRVDGRRDDIVVLSTAAGDRVPLPPLALATVVEEGARVHRFQLIQEGPRAMRVRFDAPAGVRREAAWRRIQASLREYFSRHGLDRIAIRLDPDPPCADPVSGKLHEVIGYRSARRERRSG